MANFTVVVVIVQTECMDSESEAKIDRAVRFIVLSVIVIVVVAVVTVALFYV